MKRKLRKNIMRLRGLDGVIVDEKEVIYVCETDFLMSDPTYSHLSFRELPFYRKIPRRFRIKEENHSLSIQKNIITNEFEVIKKYDREIPKTVFPKDMKRILKNIDQEEELNPFNLFSKMIRGGNLREFMQNCLNVVYKTKDLWEAIRKAEELRAGYHKNDGQSKYKRCLHCEPALSPLCLLKEETTRMEIIRLWDFDGVLFANPDNNYLDEYLTLDKIVSRSRLEKFNISFSPKDRNILFTGRGLFQRKKIIALLDEQGYKFDKYIFWLKNRNEYPTYNLEISMKEHNENYYKWKGKIIKDYARKCGNIEVIDDSNTIIQIALKVNAKARLININKEFRGD